MADISKVTLLDGSTYNIKPAVIDSAPVQNSSNPVSSGGVYTSQKAQDDEIVYAINTGAKNIIDLSHVGTTISNGVTWTKNSDGSISAKGTSTAVSSIRVAGVQGTSSYENAVPIPKGKYIISASGFSVTKYRFTFGFFENENAERELTNITNTNHEFTVTSDTARYDFTCVIALAGEVMDGETWYPMIRPAVIKDDTFVPYAPTNRELYEIQQNTVQQIGAVNEAQQEEINHLTNTGAKNLLNITERSRVHQGVTFTVNSDESVSISGGTTGSNSFMRLTGGQSSVAYNVQIPIPKGKYKISCPGASSSDSFRFAVGYRNTSSASRSTVTAQQSNNFETEFEITTDTGRFDATVLSLSTSQTYSATVYPMIRRAEIEDNTFVPYAPTNRELYSNIFGSGTPINSGVDLDTLKTAGRYYIETVTDSASLTNNPCMNELFYMNVEYVNGIVIQTIWSMAIDSAAMYRRICKDNTWRPWFKFEGTEVST